MTYRHKLTQAMARLTEMIQTPRASEAARQFNREARTSATCMCCGERPAIPDIIPYGTCRDCNATVKSLLNYKSRLTKGTLPASALPNVLALYNALATVPPALRGEADDAALIVRQVKRCIKLYYLTLIDELGDVDD